MKRFAKNRVSFCIYCYMNYGTKKPRYKKTAIILLITIMVISGIAYFRSFAKPLIFDTCRGQVNALASDCVNIATTEISKKGLIYSEYFNVLEDNGVTLVTSDAARINRLSREIVNDVQKQINAAPPMQLSLPAGTLTGINVFIGKGAPLVLSVTPIGSADCSYSSEFTSMGINQTLHRLYIRVSVSYVVALPFDTLDAEYATEILLLENVIIGKIPETYLQEGGFDSGVNLVA